MSLEHELELAKEIGGLVRRILNKSDLSRGNNTREGPELSHWEPVDKLVGAGAISLRPGFYFSP